MSIGTDAAVRLRALDLPIAAGLSDDEVTRIESTSGFTFADDHRDFLTAALPIGGAWPNWRGNVDKIYGFRSTASASRWSGSSSGTTGGDSDRRA